MEGLSRFFLTHAHRRTDYNRVQHLFSKQIYAGMVASAARMTSCKDEVIINASQCGGDLMRHKACVVSAWMLRSLKRDHQATEASNAELMPSASMGHAPTVTSDGLLPALLRNTMHAEGLSSTGISRRGRLILQGEIAFPFML